MNAPEKFTRKAQKLQTIAAQLQPFLELINTFDGKELTMPTDRFIRVHEAAEVLGGGKPTDCPLFGKVCQPLHAIGACMVSVEGVCAAWFKYGGGKFNF